MDPGHSGECPPLWQKNETKNKLTKKKKQDYQTHSLFCHLVLFYLRADITTANFSKTVQQKPSRRVKITSWKKNSCSSFFYFRVKDVFMCYNTNPKCYSSTLRTSLVHFDWPVSQQGWRYVAECGWHWLI